MQTQNLAFGFGSGNSGKIKLGTYGQSEAAAADLGRSDGGLKMQLERTFKEVESDQDLGPIATKEVKRSAKISVKLLEVTLATVARAMGLPASAITGSTLALGVPAQGEQYWTLYVNMDGVAGGTRKFTFAKVAITGNAMYEVKRDSHSAVEFEATVIWDATQPAGAEMGTIADVGNDTTPPTVALTTPASGGSVAAGTKGTVVLTITEANVIDQNSLVYGRSVMIYDITVGTAPTLVAGTIAYDANAKTITFTPTANWAAATEKYMVVVTTDLKDQAGNNLATNFVDHFVSA